jgi:hypothetical protein
MIGFFRYADKRTTNAGERWLIGQGGWTNLGSFTIGSHPIGPCLTINTSGTVNMPFGLTVGGIDVMTKFNSYAPLASPALTGSPTSTTAGTSDNSTRIATTAYVKNNLTALNSSLSNCVDLTSNQNITGVKNFGDIVVNWGHQFKWICSSDD